MKELLSTLAAVAILAASCTTASQEPVTTTTVATTTTAVPSTTEQVTVTTSTTTSTTTTTEPPTVIDEPATAFGATLAEVPLITDGTYPGPTWPRSLSGVSFADAVPEALRDDLVADGFVVEPNSDTYPSDFGLEALAMGGQFASVYERLSPYGSGERAVFVTTDAAYHHWHLVFDAILRDTEERRLLPVLEELVGDLLKASREQTASMSGTAMEEAARRAEDHLSAVATVLGLDAGSLSDLARAEVALVEEHSRATFPPTIVGKVVGSCREGMWAEPACVDYTLMKPRGHYTRSEDLTRYFKAMSMLGNTGFSLTDPDVLRVGLLISRLVVTDPDRAAAWATIYDPTAFLVGTADDYTPFEAAEATATILPDGIADPAPLTDDATVLDVGRAVLDMRPVLIDPGRASLRTMGSRFVLDSWIYDQLTDPNVSGRTVPSPLDLASVMGSSTATAVQSTAGETEAFPDYDPRVAELGESTQARTVDDWGRTVYDAWLYALEPQWADRYDPAYPPFMRGDAWDAKSLTTGFGSYTELKHDTILYAKESMAEGEGPEPKPTRHWVEPDPVSFGRLAAVTSMLRDGLIDAGLMLGDDYDAETGDPYNDDERTRWLADRLIDMFERFDLIARDELADQPIGDDDNQWLAGIGGDFERILDTAATGEGFDPAPLIADIFTDPFASRGGSYLEIATGPPDLIHVLVPDDRGGFEVATGAVYSYYEFWNDERLTDEEWWDRIIAGDLPDRPSWWTDELG